MTLKQLLIITSIATIIFWLIWTYVLVMTDPTSSGFVGLSIFYLSLLFALIGTFFLAAFGWRKIFNKFSLEYRLVGASFRQSVFISILIVGILFLQSLNFLTWWNLILLVLAVTIFEFLLVSRRRGV
ncbi:MAG: hypothetical protein AAB358_03485 [Patescibacteria group bacterium]